MATKIERKGERGTIVEMLEESDSEEAAAERAENIYA